MSDTSNKHQCNILNSDILSNKTHFSRHCKFYLVMFQCGTLISLPGAFTLKYSWVISAYKKYNQQKSCFKPSCLCLLSIQSLLTFTVKYTKKTWSKKKSQTRQIWGIWKLRPAYSPETPNLGQNRWCFVPCDLEIWWMTLENNRAPLLCCFKLCATFHSHRWIQTEVAVRNRPIWVKFDDF